MIGQVAKMTSQCCPEERGSGCYITILVYLVGEANHEGYQYYVH